MERFFNNTPQPYSSENFVANLSSAEIEVAKVFVAATDTEGFASAGADLESYLHSKEGEDYAKTLSLLPVTENKKFESGFSLFKHKIPTWIFLLVCIYLMILAFRKNLSLIPLLGLISCLYMMSEMGVSNWIGFSIWLIVGLIIYFAYSRKNSKLNSSQL